MEVTELVEVEEVDSRLFHDFFQQDISGMKKIMKQAPVLESLFLRNFYKMLAASLPVYTEDRMFYC